MRERVRRYGSAFAVWSAASLLVIACPSSAGAGPTGQALSVDQRVVRAGDGMVRGIARCVVSRAASQARFLLGTVPGSDGEDKSLRALYSRIDWCVQPGQHSGVRFAPDVFRGILAEALLTADFAGGISETRESPDDLAMWQVAYAKGERGNATRMLLEQSARCVVVRQPGAIAALIATAPFSRDEGMAIGVVTPSLSACLNTGITARLSRQSLRAVLAEALYEYAIGKRAGFGDTAYAHVEKK